MITYQYKLYKNKNNKKLHELCDSAAFVWNHCLAMQKRYYSLFGKYIPSARLQSYFAKKVKPKYAFLKNLNSQTVQEIIQRLDLAYKRFFKKLSKRPPKFKKHENFSSIVFKQTGYKFNGNKITINAIGKTFRFSLSRPYDKNSIRNIRLKRNNNGDFYLYIVSDGVNTKSYRKTHNGASVGMDFGIKTFLTLSDGSHINNPQFYKQSLNELKKAHKDLSNKVKGSNNRKKTKLKLNKIYDEITNKRNDWQWKLCHELCRKYDNIFIEDLNLEGMKKLWGRKVSDLSYGSFVSRLGYVASKYNIKVIKVNRWFASSKTCNDCGYVYKELALTDREWVCPKCGQHHDRDNNAAKNILSEGIHLLSEFK